MDGTQKKVIISVIVIVVGVFAGWGIFSLNNDSVQQDVIQGNVLEITDPDFEDKQPENTIEDFAEGVTATEFDDNSFTFDTDLGQTSISTELSSSYPNDALIIEDALIISAARSSTTESGRAMHTVFWESEESYDDLKRYIDQAKEKGWEIVDEDIFDESEYIRFQKEERRLDLSIAEGENKKREVMVLVEE